MRSHGLQSRARGRDAADSPARHHIGEAEANAVQVGRAAVGAHAEEPPADRQLLELHFVGQGDVVAEEKDVEPAPEGAERLELRIRAGDGDGNEVGLRQMRERPIERARQDPDRRLKRVTPRRKEILGGLERRQSRGITLGIHREDQVTGSGPLGVRRGQARRGEERVIRRGPQERGRLAHARQRTQRLGHPHQGDRVLVEGRPDDGPHRHRQRSSVEDARAARARRYPARRSAPDVAPSARRPARDLSFGARAKP